MSPVVASIILIAVTVAVSIAIAVWMGALTALTVTTVPEVEVRITPDIYSPNCNIGVLNDIGVFHFEVKNNSNENKTITIMIDTDQGTLVNAELRVQAASENSTTITQKLVYPGSWVISAHSEDQKLIDSYSFMTLTNDIDAEIQTNVLKQIQEATNTAHQSNNIAFASLITSTAISSVTLIVTLAVPYFRRKKRITKKAL